MVTAAPGDGNVTTLEHSASDSLDLRTVLSTFLEALEEATEILQIAMLDNYSCKYILKSNEIIGTSHA